MEWIFQSGEEKTAARYDYRARISTRTGVEKTSKPKTDKVLIKITKMEPLELGLSRPGQRRARLTVLAPRCPALLARPRNTGVQTIPFEDETL